MHLKLRVLYLSSVFLCPQQLCIIWKGHLSWLVVIASKANPRISGVKNKLMIISKKLLFRILKHFTATSFNDNHCFVIFDFLKLYLMFVKFSQAKPLPCCHQCPTVHVTQRPVALWYTSLGSLTLSTHSQMSSDTRGFVKGLLFHDICVVSQVQSCGYHSGAY